MVDESGAPGDGIVSPGGGGGGRAEDGVEQACGH